MLDAYAPLPADLTDEELGRDWTLTEEDREAIHRCHGDANRHRFAVQLCALRSQGHFIDGIDDVPVRIVNHVGRQLGLPPSLFMAPSDRAATDTGHAQRIRAHLHYQPFDDQAQERLRRWLDERAIAGVLGTPLLELAASALRSWQVELPARSTLERVVNSCTARGEEATWQRIQERLTPDFCAAVDALLAVPEGDRRSEFNQFKEYPPEARPGAILAYLDRYRRLRSVGTGNVDLVGLGQELVEHLADLARRYDVDDLKRFAPGKRYALVACLLAESQKTILDHLVEMHRDFLTGMSRRAHHAVDERHREVRQRAGPGLATAVRVVEILADRSRPREKRLEDLYREFNEAELGDAAARCRDLNALAEHGYFDELLARHSHLKRYLPGFLELPFEGGPGTEPLLAAIEIARRLHAGEIAELPKDAPTQFATGAWRAALAGGDGRRDWRLWEIALAFGARDALRSGDLYLAESRHHVSFWDLLHRPAEWEEKRTSAYSTLNLPTEADRAIDRLRLEMNEVVSQLAGGLDANPFVSLLDGRLEYSRDDAHAEPDDVGELRRVIETHLPRVRIEDLLMEVDSWCGFTRELVPPDGYRSGGAAYPALLASLVAHGTNLGISTMAEGLSVDVLQDASRWCLRQETLKAANGVLVDHHHRLPHASVWGQGVASSSDGQRFGIQAPSLLASFYPRYFGYYDRAVSVYTHVSDQFSVFSTRVISCSPREAIYVLDGILENDTVLRPREHCTDTHGFTEQLFGLCHLLGIAFMPRLKDLKDQQLYRIDRENGFGPLAPIFRGTIDGNLIREQWDQLVRVAASLKNRTAPAHVVLERLVASSPSDRLAKALTMLGRAVKTLFILRYAHDAELRARVHRQLNRGEARHALARRLFFANQGAFRVGDYEEIMNKASALALLSNAVLVWNTVRISEIVAALERGGQRVSREYLARISPLANAHVIPSGTYHFERAAAGP
ncbi:MAG TPA: Tn3 family transposase [Anaeromyxobacteraceae bacterium]|nr:Tn3 family transposase [Anaeromyxobacteraceae bacterium]